MKLTVTLRLDLSSEEACRLLAEVREGEPRKEFLEEGDAREPLSGLVEAPPCVKNGHMVCHRDNSKVR
jgi:hypothetical protein